MGEPFHLSQTARYYDVLSRRCIIQANLESTISTSRNCVKDIVWVLWHDLHENHKTKAWGFKKDKAIRGKLAI